MAKNADLSAAKTAKKDEFYTQLTDIEKDAKIATPAPSARDLSTTFTH